MASDCCVYLDYNATTPLEPKVLEAITTALKDAWGNPSSAHHAGKLNAYSNYVNEINLVQILRISCLDENICPMQGKETLLSVRQAGGRN